MRISNLWNAILLDLAIPTHTFSIFSSFRFLSYLTVSSVIFKPYYFDPLSVNHLSNFHNRSRMLCFLIKTLGLYDFVLFELIVDANKYVMKKHARSGHVYSLSHQIKMCISAIRKEICRFILFLSSFSKNKT